MRIVIWIRGQELSEGGGIGALVADLSPFGFGNIVDQEEFCYRQYCEPDHEHNCKGPIEVAPVIGDKSTEVIEFSVPFSPAFRISYKYDEERQQGEEVCEGVEEVDGSHDGRLGAERVEGAHFPAGGVIKVAVGKNGCKPGGCEHAVFCSNPDEKRDKQNEKDGMHELPVAQEVKELVSGLMAYAVTGEGKEDVWDEIQVREN